MYTPSTVTERLESISSWILVVVVFLTPLFFISGRVLPLEMSKIILLALGVLIPGGLYVIGRIRAGSIEIPKGPFAYSLYGIAAAAIITGFASPAINTSFFGQGTETLTVAFFALMVVATLLIGLMFRTKERILYLYTAFMLSFFVLALLHVIRIVFGVDTLSFGGLTTPVANFVGRFNDLGVFFMISALFSFASIELFSAGKYLKGLLYAVLVVSLGFVSVVNFTALWYIIALAAVLLVVIRARTVRDVETQGIKKLLSKASILSMVIFIIAGVSIIKGAALGGSVATSLGMNQLDVRPSWQLTLDIATDAVKFSPLFGVGPNRFLNQYLLSKSTDINTLAVWNVDFAYGFGYIPTFIAMEGLLGLIAWIFFGVVLVKMLMKLCTRSYEDPFVRYLAITTSLLAVALWLVLLVYVPSLVIIFLAFVITGAMFALLSMQGIIPVKIVDFNNPEAKKLVRLSSKASLVLAFLVVLVWGFVYVKKTVAMAYFQRALVAVNTTGDLEKADTLLKSSRYWDSSNDAYARAHAELGVLRITKLVQTAGQNDPEALKKLEEILTESMSEAQAAIALDPTFYANYLAEARVAETVAPLKVKNAYETAQKDYAAAITLNPQNPSFFLSLAQLEVSLNKLAEAKPFIGRALQLKNNYTDAVFLLSQIQVAEGNVKDAINSVVYIAQLNPNDATVFFQLGLLKYNIKDYAGTIEAMKRATDLNPQYANARYFLGLSLAQQGKYAEAKSEFEIIQQSNPESQEVKLILENLSAGRSPFTNAKPPIDTTPEKRKALPVVDKTEAKKSSTNK